MKLSDCIDRNSLSLLQLKLLPPFPGVRKKIAVKFPNGVPNKDYCNCRLLDTNLNNAAMISLVSGLELIPVACLSFLNPYNDDLFREAKYAWAMNSCIMWVQNEADQQKVSAIFEYCEKQQTKSSYGLFSKIPHIIIYKDYTYISGNLEVKYVTN